MIPHKLVSAAALFGLMAGLSGARPVQLPPESELAGDPAGCCSETKALLRGVLGPASDAAGPIRLALGARQLFLDNHVLSRLENVERKLHQPKKYGAVIRPDQPWEGDAIQSRSAPVWSREERVWKAWYFGNGLIFYAVSDDGIHWKKPALGKVDFNGSKQNNVIAVEPSLKWPDNAVLNVIYDLKDPEPHRRYKGFLGAFYRKPIISPNGMDWTVLDAPRIPSSDESGLYYDPQRGVYLATVKHGGPYGRSVYLTVSRDFEHWTDPRDCLLFHADKRDQALGMEWIVRRFADTILQQPEYNISPQHNVDVYHMAVFRYRDLYLGLPSLFHQTGKVAKDWDGFDRLKRSPALLKEVRSCGDWTWFHHLQLMVSRDLLEWQRAGRRQPFIDASPVNPGAYDLQTILAAGGAIVRDGEIWLYYTGLKHYAYISSGERDDGAVCLAKLRLDGFVSLDAGDTEGQVVTKPLVMSGKSLHVNVDAPSGELRAEVLDAGGEQVLPGDSQRQSASVRGDRLDAAGVTWKGSTLAALAGRTVRLRFMLRNAGLYVFCVE